VKAVRFNDEPLPPPPPVTRVAVTMTLDEARVLYAIASNDSSGLSVFPTLTSLRVALKPVIESRP